MIRVKFLFVEGCPASGPTLKLLRQVIRDMGVPARVKIVRLVDPDSAREQRFLGSPSIRIDGRDLEGGEPGEATLYGCGCRLYREQEPGMPTGTPSRKLIARALLAAQLKKIRQRSMPLPIQ